MQFDFCVSATAVGFGSVCASRVPGTWFGDVFVQESFCIQHHIALAHRKLPEYPRGLVVKSAPSRGPQDIGVSSCFYRYGGLLKIFKLLLHTHRRQWRSTRWNKWTSNHLGRNWGIGKAMQTTTGRTGATGVVWFLGSGGWLDFGELASCC